jgi:hypothetical protein
MPRITEDEKEENNDDKDIATLNLALPQIMSPKNMTTPNVIETPMRKSSSSSGSITELYLESVAFVAFAPAAVAYMPCGSASMKPITQQRNKRPRQSLSNLLTRMCIPGLSIPGSTAAAKKAPNLLFTWHQVHDCFISAFLT